MAWTAPTSWVAGQMVVTADLNNEIRDNLLELDFHNHSGGSGSGTAALGNLVSMTLIDAALPAAPGGTLSVLASSATNLYIRSGGGASRQITVPGHTHGY